MNYPTGMFNVWLKKIPETSTTLPDNNVSVLSGELSKIVPRNNIVELNVKHLNNKIDILRSKFKKFKTRRNARKEYSTTFINEMEPIAADL